MRIDVLEFQLPNGRQVPRELDIDESCKDNYELLCSHGLRMTAEALRTGEVSQTIEGPDYDYDIIITKGPDLEENKKACEALILRFNETKYLAFDKQFNDV